MNDNPKIYVVFTRSATNWREFAKSRKNVVRRNLTWAEARSLCERENAELTAAQKRRGMKYEFTSEAI